MKLDRYTMMWQITMHTNYSEEALLKMTDEDLLKLYEIKVEKKFEVE